MTKKYEAFTRFESFVTSKKVENSVTDYINSDVMAENIFCALTESIRIKLCPVFSDKPPSQVFSKYTRFNVWLLGLTKGLELMPIGDFMNDEKREEECERCYAGDCMPAGNLTFITMSTLTATFLVLQCVSLTKDYKEKINEIKCRINIDSSKK